MKRSIALAAVAALLVAGPAHGATDGRDAPRSPLDLSSATITQDGNDLVLAIHTRGSWASRVMTSRPGRSLCATLTQGARRFVCASATRTGGPGLTVNAAGGAPAPLRAEILRRDLSTFVARFAASGAGLTVGRFTWTVTSTWADSEGCATPAPGCNDRLPDRGAISARLLPPAPTGCVARGASYRTNGPRERRAVALTFDDGPGPYTSRVLDVLRRGGAKGTFFVVGQHVSGGTGVLRRALREGHALANHS